MERMRHNNPLSYGKVEVNRVRPVLRCDEERQSRGHLFKECKRWKRDIRRLWEEVDNISGKGETESHGG